MQRPATTTRRRLATGRRNELGFAFAIELAILPISRPFAKYGRLEAVFDQSLSHTMHGGKAHLGEFRRPLVGPCRTALRLVGFQQNPSPLASLLCTAPLVDDGLQLPSLLIAQSNNVLGFLAHV